MTKRPAEYEIKRPFDRCFMPFAIGFFASLLLWVGLEVAFGSKNNNDRMLATGLGLVSAFFATAIVSIAVAGWVQLRLGKMNGTVDSNKAFIVGLSALIFMFAAEPAIELALNVLPGNQDSFVLFGFLVWPVVLAECIIFWSAKSVNQQVNEDRLDCK